MKLKLLYLLAVAFVFTACQFTETMVLNADGSGTMQMELNLDQMIEISQGMSEEKEEIKMDTLVYLKDLLEEKKDSISKLPKKEQELLKELELEKYSLQVKADSDESIMRYNLMADFKNVTEMNGILEAFEKVSNLAPKSEAGSLNSSGESEDLIGVNYSFKNNKFIRDAYIKNKVLHKQQMDSMQSVEGFLGSSVYALHYTFPKKVKKTSNPDAKLSNNNKTVIVQVPFIDYYKNPDVLDLEIELEN